MAARRIAALSSPSPASNLAGRPHLQFTRDLASNGCWNGGHRLLKTNLLVQGSRLINVRHDPQSSSSVTLGRNTVGRKLQACLAARNMRCNSEQGSSNVVTATLGRNTVGRKLQACLAARNMRCNSEQGSSNVVTADVQETFPDETYDRLAEGQQVPLYDTASPKQNPRGLTGEREPHPYEDVHIGASWREIQGESNWEGLMLDPLDHRLRSELVRYGEFAQATYDAFDQDEFSKFCGCCKYRKRDYFEKLGLRNRGYEIVEYIYSTTEVQEDLSKFFKTSRAPPDEKWSTASNWAGFVAVCTSPEEIARLGRRDIVVAWRGTVTQFEWIEDLELSLCPTGPDPWAVQNEPKRSPSRFGSVKVEKGFLSLYESTNEGSRHNNTSSAKHQVRRALKWLMKRFKGEQMSITLTGHSLGASLATLCAYDIAEYLLHEQQGRDLPMITAFVFASPRVGNTAFKDVLENLNVKVLRVVNIQDFVPCVPGLLFHEKIKFSRMYVSLLRKSLLIRMIQRVIDFIPATYSNVGVELEVDNLQSPFVQPTRSPVSTHNLELYLHLVAGLQDKARAFSEALCTRDLALVNKTTSLLTHKHSIPAAWYQEENKGLVKIGGRFTYRPVPHEDFPEQPLDEDAFDRELHYIH